LSQLLASGFGISSDTGASSRRQVLLQGDAGAEGAAGRSGDGLLAFMPDLVSGRG